MQVLRLIRAALITGIVGGTLAVPVAASAEDLPSTSVAVSSVMPSPGETITATQTVTNIGGFTLVNAQAAMYALDQSLTDWFQLVSCSGATTNCFVADGQNFRAALGDLPAGESRTVVWTLRVRDDTRTDPFRMRIQLRADNYAFDILDGPRVDIVPGAADIAVTLNASVRSGLVPRITYTVTIKNNGPGAATGVRVLGTVPSNLTYAAGGTCTRVGTTRTANCDVASLDSGASTTRTFAGDAGVLTIGTLQATAARTASSPDDPVATNDKATRTCTALTGLIVRC
ncbi:putative repeat protein (TIGR01451 family) [Kribbella pratensis]|uniref:Repeat protein (TIGR01451 family) n=1 Tax=Kribbella pratensis TaxID=2512112 RepID=A0ABY2FJ33_9ACTN|nr:putative repeat protein (TIGR01451 family) [Kribbella pratensis]TDW98662.1 putative repeat protein (TIGR01451 family) [Kribbella sp. VKM Ac-2566]